eukprot:1967840-Rhodomonas_salina.1
MTKLHDVRLGVANGTDPLLVIEPIFVGKQIEQNMPLWKVVNTLFVSLQTNCDFAAGSILRVVGLSGAVVSSGSLRVDGYAAGDRFQWFQSPADW